VVALPFRITEKIVSLCSRPSANIRLYRMKAKADQSDHLRTAATVVATLLSSDEVDDTVAEASPFDSIYDTYAPLLRRIAVSRFGIPTAYAADLVHDVFATYLVNPKRVEELRPYLIGAICNASRSYLRKSTRSAVCSAIEACATSRVNCNADVWIVGAARAIVASGLLLDVCEMLMGAKR
jgi:hypothetical protein